MNKSLTMIMIAALGLFAYGLKSSAETQKSEGAKEPPAQQQPSKKPVERITTEPVTDTIYRLNGPGGNIAVLIGDDGAFIVDDKFDRFGEQIIDTVKALTDKPIRFVINTHYHGDHTGANAKMKAAGATIIAHENVRARMGVSFENKLWGRTVEATEATLWPDVTFSENATFHLNGQTVELFHIPTAHTDGDTIIRFKDANVIHMGDNYFNGMFPYVDIDSGGSLQGMIAAQDMALSLSDEKTKIIPGHGPMATRDELSYNRDHLQGILSRIQSAVSSGKELDEILAEKPLSDLRKFSGFINEDMMVRIAYRSVTERQ